MFRPHILHPAQLCPVPCALHSQTRKFPEYFIIFRISKEFDNRHCFYPIRSKWQAAIAFLATIYQVGKERGYGGEGGKEGRECREDRVGRGGQGCRVGGEWREQREQREQGSKESEGVKVRKGADWKGDTEKRWREEREALRLQREGSEGRDRSEGWEVRENPQSGGNKRSRSKVEGRSGQSTYSHRGMFCSLSHSLYWNPFPQPLPSSNSCPPHTHSHTCGFHNIS
jgi:hypothetical protein